MRTITKSEPQRYADWRAQQPAPPRSVSHPTGYTYESIPADVKAAIRRGLFKEQGELDAYTGERIHLGDEESDSRRPDDDFHTEHLYPQDYCSDAEAVDYQNMAGCRPGERAKTKHLPYGARHKDRCNPGAKAWPNSQQLPSLVRPTDANLEARFTYTRDGLMKPARPDDLAAAETIKALNIGGETQSAVTLKDNRAAVYKRAVRDYSRLQAAKTRLAQIDRAETDLAAGESVKLDEFVFVEKYALRKLIKKVGFIRKSRKAQ